MADQQDVSTIPATPLSAQSQPASEFATRAAAATPTTRPRVQFRWLIRPRRVLFVLAALWVLNLFDLGFTLLESTRTNFVELNPLVAHHVRNNPTFVVAYKFTLVAAGSTILLAFRRQRVAELGCWLLLGIYVLLLIHWSGYYEYLSDTLCDPATNVPPLIGMA